MFKPPPEGKSRALLGTASVLPEIVDRVTLRVAFVAAMPPPLAPDPIPAEVSVAVFPETVLSVRFKVPELESRIPAPRAPVFGIVTELPSTRLPFDSVRVPLPAQLMPPPATGEKLFD